MWKINDLYNIINNYMLKTVDGDTFKLEQNFEDAVRKVIKANGFTVLPKQNVTNTQTVAEQRNFGAVEDQIPDIAVKCSDGLVFLELKLRRSPEAYESDIKKVEKFVKKGKCDVSGVLFLDNVPRQGWTTCQANKAYNYLF